jgi:dTDP-4-amino-4,6-dideoxygalactose transaminase
MSAENSAEHEAEPKPEAFVQTAKAAFSELDRWKQVGEEEARVAYEMTLRNELSGGTPVVREFEAAWRDWTGLKHALTVFNGTAALYSAMYGLGVGPGDEVICPAYTWICTISPAVFLGARPVFCESDPDYMVLDPEDVRRRITPKTRAIVAVHLWGWVCDMDALMKISEDTGIPVIEDCSHAHGALCKGKPAGSIGRAGCWSLQGSKPVSAGEGGVLATNDTDLFERACLVGQVNRIVGMDLATERYREYQPLGTGMKLRAHPLGIGIASVQLRKLPELNEGRRRYVEAIEAGLAEIPGVRPVPTVPGTTRGGFYGFPIHYHPDELGGLSRDGFVTELQQEGIPATGDSGYPLLHMLPLFSKGFDIFTGGRGPLVKDGYRRGDLPATEKMHDNLMLIPVMTDPVPGATDYVLERIRRVVERHAR